MDQQTRTKERRLPTGVAEFEQLIADLKAEYGEDLPTVDEDSLKFVMASTIMHLGPLDSHKTLEFFYKTIVAGASKQVAHFMFRDVKLRQDAANKAAEEAARASLESLASDVQASRH